MKRVYAAAALMVAVGGAIGYMLAPQAPAPQEQVVAEQTPDSVPAPAREKPRKRSGGGGGGFFTGTSSAQNPIEKMVVAKASGGGSSRPDCYFIGVSYRSELKRSGPKSPKALAAANNAKEAGCTGF